MYTNTLILSRSMMSDEEAIANSKELVLLLTEKEAKEVIKPMIN
jgi:hypothetical protein